MQQKAAKNPSTSCRWQVNINQKQKVLLALCLAAFAFSPASFAAEADFQRLFGANKYLGVAHSDKTTGIEGQRIASSTQLSVQVADDGKTLVIINSPWGPKNPKREMISKFKLDRPLQQLYQLSNGIGFKGTGRLEFQAPGQAANPETPVYITCGEHTVNYCNIAGPQGDHGMVSMSFLFEKDGVMELAGSSLGISSQSREVKWSGNAQAKVDADRDAYAPAE